MNHKILSKQESIDALVVLLQQIYALPADKRTIDAVKLLKREYAKHHSLSDVPSNVDLLAVYRYAVAKGIVTADSMIEKLFMKRAIRSQSGIVSVQVLTKPYRCPGKCIFCPNDFTMPKSYINTEPGAMRALLNNFDPIKQVYNRLLSLTLTGHVTDKIEMIVLGGTRDVYPQDYKECFVKSLYDACNTFSLFWQKVSQENDPTKKFCYAVQELEGMTYPTTIDDSIHINETAQHRIIGLTVETRPEYVNDENCQFWRTLGVTRIEMGIQSMFDDVLHANKRGHTVEQSRQAVHVLRKYGFKMSLHIMPGLYGSDYQKDLETFVRVYDDTYIRPDEIKFYPTSVIPNTELYDLYRAGKYQPLDTDTIQKLIKETFLSVIPPYTRIKRLIRDIPSTEIIAGSQVTNLAQMTHDQLKKAWKQTPEAEKLYRRLYTDYICVQTQEQLYTQTDVLYPVSITDTTVYTYIVGSEPDFFSFRNFVCLDTRSREIRNKYHQPNRLAQTQEETGLPNLVIRKYASSMGTEYFISYEDSCGYLYGLCRLLLPDPEKTVVREGLGPDYAMIRELHVYGKVAGLKKEKNADETTKQHQGVGSKLVACAEEIASRRGYVYLSIISGVGVRAYYTKLGYGLQGTYMVKNLLLL